MAESDGGEDDRWKTVIERVKPAMVTLHGESLLNPDGGGAFTGIGSGFCVDTELGLILTNRHVVTRGPTTILVEWGSSREEQLGSVSPRLALARLPMQTTPQVQCFAPHSVVCSRPSACLALPT